MHRTSNIRSIFLNVGIIVAAISVGSLIEFSRSDQMRTRALFQVWCFSLISYFIPAIWFTCARPRNLLAWLVIPILGTILVQMIVVQIPNEISIWNQSNGEDFIAAAVAALPNQFVNFSLFFLFYSAISCLIIGLAQVLGLGFLQLRNKFVNENRFTGH